MEENQFREALAEKGIELSEKQMEQYNSYYRTLTEWNQKMNLTAITEKNEVYLKHFYDSVSVAFYYDFNKPLNIVDVGAGAGFPSIPLKIAFPDLHVTIVDSLNKRITFLNELASVLNLKGVAFIHDRAELFGKNKSHREHYDIAMARAVARLPVLSELCLPLVKKEGYFIAMKGAGAQEEINDAGNAFELLGGELKTVDTFRLPSENSERSIVKVAKVRKTPKQYPRKAGTPNKEPL
ncbi:16S rRNA (guanine(527)-N(7))-methyltransferase RsmG [Evansella sp. LMS18]|jgi:16S rRNA (guanine527-N7)-methyltransferase|uniref:16S rRNA (guanine(527)-N(7))-methyltransferase RsmG n=1 Tax=Evansella sp. LMS18 TaxID=2924033 RepID=UPI0020D0B144|nr:16S rRNA (guanine(527)-N(7))-methyltransferase RsmG [Evansella sp. LMS18]UTR12379.1 16S rRNA (guanine(527)-N(7))-methyltransferase RsmG [Evansella sp. LMS18]